MPPAPRGIPQIEVSFDIDANGIVHVTAKDLATGREQRIRIESSSGLTEAEIQRMVKDAEAHQREDQEQKHVIEVRNNAETLVYSVEKTLKENGNTIGAEDRASVERALDRLRDTLKGHDTAAIEAAANDVTAASHKLAEAMYAATAGAAHAQAEPGPMGPEPGRAADDTVDADYKVMND